MLNIGQVVYDYTNNRVVIFAGLEMLQNQKTGRCRSESGFVLKDGTFIHLKGKKAPFKYTNLNMEGKPFTGSFITKCGCSGYFFGIIDGNDTEVKIWAKEAIEETEKLIAKCGLSITKEMINTKTVNRYHIGQPIKYKPYNYKGRKKKKSRRGN